MDMKELNRSDATPLKRTRKKMPLSQKVELLDLLKTGMSIAAVGRHFGINESSVRFMKTNEQKVRDAAAAYAPGGADSVYTVRDLTVVQMERSLNVWIEEQRQQSRPINGSIIREKAMLLYNSLKNKQSALKEGSSNNAPQERDFNASRGWFENFKKRFALSNVYFTHDTPLEKSFRSLKGNTSVKELGKCVKNRTPRSGNVRTKAFLSEPNEGISYSSQPVECIISTPDVPQTAYDSQDMEDEGESLSHWIDETEESGNQPALNGISVPSTSTESTIRQPLSKKQKMEHMHHAAEDHKPIVDNSTRDDDLDHFAKFVTLQLRSLPSTIVPELQMEIQDLISNCRTKYQRRSVRSSSETKPNYGFESNFAEDQLESLITLVKERPSLYDTTSNNEKQTNKAWNEISSIMNESETACRFQWQILVNSFKTRAAQAERTNGSQNSKDPWRWFHKLKFLGKKDNERINESDEIIVKHEPISPSSQYPEENPESISPSEDNPKQHELNPLQEDSSFFISLLPHVQKLIGENKIRFRLEVQRILLELLPHVPQHVMSCSLSLTEDYARRRPLPERVH